MIKIKHILLLIITVMITLLTGCINSGSPVYVESISVYANNQLLTGSLKYYDGTSWQDYDENKSTKEKIYYSVDTKSENVRIVFNVYAPNTTLNEVRLLTNSNLYYANNNTVFITDNIVKENNTYLCTYEFMFDNGYNAVTVTGFSTTNGLKYMGAKSSSTKFVLYGVHLQLVE